MAERYSVRGLSIIGAKASWLRIQEIATSASINRLMAIEGVKETILSEEILSARHMSLQGI